MKKWWALVCVLLIIIVAGMVALVVLPSHTASAPAVTTADTAALVPAAPHAPVSDSIVVDSPVNGSTVASPLAISGQALGSWYFEGTAPVALLDSSGSVIAQGAIVANGDWTSPGFVPFSGSLDFPAQPAGSTGTLVLTNDNPSGNPANQKTLDMPVQF